MALTVQFKLNKLFNQFQANQSKANQTNNDINNNNNKKTQTHQVSYKI